jgi:hypothetical protein
MVHNEYDDRTLRINLNIEHLPGNDSALTLARDVASLNGVFDIKQYPRSFALSLSSTSTAPLLSKSRLRSRVRSITASKRGLAGTNERCKKSVPAVANSDFSNVMSFISG